MTLLPQYLSLTLVIWHAKKSLYISLYWVLTLLNWPSQLFDCAWLVSITTGAGTDLESAQMYLGRRQSFILKPFHLFPCYIPCYCWGFSSVSTTSSLCPWPRSTSRFWWPLGCVSLEWFHCSYFTVFSPLGSRWLRLVVFLNQGSKHSASSHLPFLVMFLAGGLTLGFRICHFASSAPPWLLSYCHQVNEATSPSPTSCLGSN